MAKIEQRAEKNPIINWLEEWEVQWVHLVNVDPSQFDVERSLLNQARLGDPIDAEVKARYAEAMRDGQVFPSVVASQGSNGYVIIDGNHRMIAAKETGTLLGVYVVSARPQVLTTMTMEANVRHGKPTSEAERVHHALYLIDNGMTQREAAHRMGAPLSKVKKAVLASEANRRADSVGILRKDWDALPESVRSRLLNVSTDEGLVAATQLALDAGLLVDEVFSLVSQLNTSRSGTRQQQYVEAMREVYAERIQDRRRGEDPGSRRRIRSPRAAVAMALGQLSSWPPPTSVVEATPPAEREELKLRLKEALDRMNQMYEAL